MYEFIFGFVTGAFTSKLIARKSSERKDVMVQADDVVIKTSEPILIPKKKRAFVPGELKNFWGQDS